MMDYILYKIQNNMYDVITYITVILYIVILFGLSINAPEYLKQLNLIVKIYISLFLIYRFNPYRRIRINDLDVKMSFSAGLFLLASIVVNNKLINTIKEMLKPFWH